MSKFEFIMMFVSVVVAFAMSELLVGWGRLIRARDRLKRPWLMIGWSVWLLGIINLHYLGFWEYGLVDFRTAAQMLLFLAAPILLVLVTFVFTPEIRHYQKLDLEQHYFRIKNWFFIMVIIFFVLARASDVLLPDYSTTWLMRSIGTIIIVPLLIALLFVVVGFCFFYHLANGIRHLLWDAGYGFDRDQIRISGWTVVAFAALGWFYLKVLPGWLGLATDDVRTVQVYGQEVGPALRDLVQAERDSDTAGPAGPASEGDESPPPVEVSTGPGGAGKGTISMLIAARLGADVEEVDYFAARDALVQAGQAATGRGRGGSVRRVLDAGTPLTLEAQQVPADAPAPKPAKARKAAKKAAARRSNDATDIIAYQHDQKRRNNPDVGVVTPETDPEQPRTTWAYDPHIDPALQFDSGRSRVEKLIDDALETGTGRMQEFQQELLAWIDHALAGQDEAAVREVVHNLRRRVEETLPVPSEREALEQLKRQAAPYLNWTGKAERTSFEIDTVSLHVHERIDPASILAVVRKRLQQEKGEHGGTADMFRAWFEEPLPYREAIEFYKHDRGWANRLIAGDSLLVMNSLLQKEGMAGQVQMIYIDPPYGIKYGSNFQPFVNKRDVKDRKDEDLTQEPEMIKAFRDTWELGIHSYLTYLRDRLLLAKELLSESGSVFVQISDENLHHVRELCDEIFGASNLVRVGSPSTTSPSSSPPELNCPPLPRRCPSSTCRTTSPLARSSSRPKRSATSSPSSARSTIHQTNCIW